METLDSLHADNPFHTDTSHCSRQPQCAENPQLSRAPTHISSSSSSSIIHLHFFSPLIWLNGGFVLQIVVEPLQHTSRVVAKPQVEKANPAYVLVLVVQHANHLLLGQLQCEELVEQTDACAGSARLGNPRFYTRASDQQRQPYTVRWHMKQIHTHFFHTSASHTYTYGTQVGHRYDHPGADTRRVQTKHTHTPHTRRVQMHTHTHTHTHIYIYIYIYPRTLSLSYILQTKVSNFTGNFL
jgi:hypothetical protein